MELYAQMPLSWRDLFHSTHHVHLNRSLNHQDIGPGPSLCSRSVVSNGELVKMCGTFWKFPKKKTVPSFSYLVDLVICIGDIGYEIIPVPKKFFNLLDLRVDQLLKELFNLFNIFVRKYENEIER
jgi:hypothetical protein